MTIFTWALILLITLNVGVALGFWICSALRDLDDDIEYVGTLPSREELLQRSY